MDRLPPVITHMQLDGIVAELHAPLSILECDTPNVGPYLESPALARIQLPRRGLLEFLFAPMAAFDSSLLGLQLPITLHTLHFGAYFNQSLDRVELPPSLTDLFFGKGI